MTSNIGAEVIKNQGSLGFRATDGEMTYAKMKERLLQEIDKHFRPEFLNRLDDIIVFRALTREDLKTVVEYEMAHVKERLEDRGVTLELTDEAKEFIIEKGYSSEYGARPLKRTIERLIEDPMSEEILRGQFKNVLKVVLRLRDGHLYFDAIPREETAKAASSGTES
jgi:ATP-dependent Clp protease ATP-binding subunit ClpC